MSDANLKKTVTFVKSINNNKYIYLSQNLAVVLYSNQYLLYYRCLSDCCT